MTDTGHYDHLLEKRDAVLSGCRVSPRARAAILGRNYSPPPAKSHTIDIDLQTEIRTVITEEFKATPKPPAPKGPFLSPAGPGAWRCTSVAADASSKANDIICAVCEAYGADIWGILSPSRQRKDAWPRFAIMGLLSGILKISTPSVGRILKRDHTTVMAGLRRVADLRATDRLYRHHYRTAVKLLRQRWAVQ